MFFNDQYKKFHMGNIVTSRFKEIYNSDRYWAVINYLASPNFNAQSMCGTLCLQHKVNEYLDGVKKGQVGVKRPEGKSPEHLNFV